MTPVSHTQPIPYHERGAVLLTTLLIMAIMAAVSVALMDDIRMAVKRAANVQAYAQTDWYVSGAEDFAHSYLSSQLEQVSAQGLNGALINPAPVILPLENGVMTLRVTDGSACLSLNSVSNAQTRRPVERVLEFLGWGETEANRLSAEIMDWRDSDTQTQPGGAEDFDYLGRNPAYRTANTDFQSVQELRALRSMNETRYQTVRPFICARPQLNVDAININTLTTRQLPLLAAILGGERPMIKARQLLNDRPPGGYTGIDQVTTHPTLEDYDLKNAALEKLVFQPNYLWVEATVQYQNAIRHMALEFSVDGIRATRIFKSLSAESFRPVMGDTET